MEYVAIILICALFADGLVKGQKLKDLTDRVKDLEKACAANRIQDKGSDGDG